MMRATASVVPYSCRRNVGTPVCLASNLHSELLRSQLDQLHAEAESTRAKANSARLRLLRLTEAAENLRRQAAVSIQRGKENDARELLFQKKKVMQALETSRSRIELLDKLSSRLREAISLKEAQLIENIASDLEVGIEDDSSPVHIIYPKQQVPEYENKNEDSYPNASIINGEPKFHLHGKLERIRLSAGECQEQKESECVSDEDSLVLSLAAINSYEGFLEHLDQQLSKVEQEIVTVLNVSALFIDNREKPKNSRLQQTMELLEAILDLRQRITNIRQNTGDIS